MFAGFDTLVYFYAKKHWDSRLPKELRASKKDMVLAAERFLASKKNTKNGVFIRLVGQSGVGKTTQLLPAAISFFKDKKIGEVVVAAREFVKLHPHYEEILERYGKNEIRKRTDDFATVVMFYVLRKLTKAGSDFILDLSFVNSKIEWIFRRMTKKYTRKIFLMMVVPRWKNLELLAKRDWRHGEKLEEEFWRSTSGGLRYYSKFNNAGRIVMWGADRMEPIYDGGFEKSFEIFKEEIRRKKVNKANRIEDLIEGKRLYLKDML